MISGAKSPDRHGNKAVIDELATFVRVVRSGSLAGAARELGVPKSTVSRRLNRLETELNVKLIHRGARNFTLTTEGNRLFDRVHLSIDQVELAIHAAFESGTLPKGNIRITAPDDFGRLLLLDELLAFSNVWPAITFELDLTSRYVDLVSEGYDLAIRASSNRALPGPGNLISRKLLTSKLHIAASGSSAPVKTLADLQTRPFVLFRQPSRRQTLELTSGSGRTHRVPVKGRFVVNDYSSMAQLVAQGAGFGLMPLMHIEHSDDALRCILPKYSVATEHIALVYPSRQLPRRVSLLIEHLTVRLGAKPSQTKST